jgi:hypothetical protein
MSGGPASMSESMASIRLGAGRECRYDRSLCLDDADIRFLSVDVGYQSHVIDPVIHR